MDRLLQKTSSKVTLRLYDATGALVDADTPPNVEIFDGAGAQHIAPGASVRDSLGTYSKTLTPAQTALLDTYRAEWTATIGAVAGNVFETRYEVVGGFFFTIAQARAFDDGVLTNVDDHPTSDLVDAREAIESDLERGRVAFVPRGRRATLDGSGSSVLLLPDMFVRSVYSVSVDGVAMTSGELAEIKTYGPEGKLWLARWPSGERNVVVHYAHGLDECPPEVRRIALKLLVHHRTTTSDEDNDAKSESIGTYSIDYGEEGPSVFTADDEKTLDSFRVPVVG